MTKLTNTQIAQLTAILTGGGFKKAADTKAAIRRFRNVAAETGAFAAEAVEETLGMDFASATKVVTAIKAGIDQANGSAPHVGATASPEARKTSPGLARLRAAEQAADLRASTLSDADKARAAVVAGMPSARKAALELGVEPIVAPAKVVSVRNSKPKAEKPAKAEGEKSTRTKLDPAQKISAVVANPKKAGSKSFAIFALYKAGQTVKQFTDAVIQAGYSATDANGNLSWDRRKGFITIEELKAA